MKTNHRLARTKRRTALRFAALALAGVALGASAATTDLAPTPLVTAAPNAVKPNIMFILDDSGSMDRDYMPDDASNFDSSEYGRFASQCNGLAYNPSITYDVPVDSTGTPMAAGTYTFASPGDASTYPFYYTYSGSQPALGYAYNTTGRIDNTFYLECNSDVGVAPGNGLFTRVTVSPTTITQNYRNWYTYHRTRMLTMRTATSRAFAGIDDKYRVGFSTISSVAVDGTNFLDVSDFDATQKATWYTRLFGADPDSYTPLRGALSKAGQYYAKRGKRGNGTDQSYDPVQFSCQKNFAILTTDGYWNADTETSTYGPFRLDGSSVGQQDGTAARPMRDSATAVVQERTSLLQQRSVTTQSATVAVQSATVAVQTRLAQLQASTSGDRGVTWSAWSNAASCRWDTGGKERTRCQYAPWSAWSAAATCTPAALQTNTNDGTTWTGNARECTASQSPWTSTASCTASGSSGPTSYVAGTLCAATQSAWTNTPSCTPSSPAASTGPTNYVAGTRCNTVIGSWTNAASCTASATQECQYTAWTAYANTASCTPAARSSGPNYTVPTARECQTTTTGGSSDSLADVAMYYYETDLRTSALGNCTLASGTNVCNNNVPPRGLDDATHQHMTTFTLGLGVGGTLGYHPNYLGGQSPDYQAITAGTKNWPNPGSGAANIDDLWHAAVNGRGQYFNAGNPTVLARSLTDTLTAIDARSGTAAAAATSTLQPVPGDNTEFVTSYTTVYWVGDVVAYQVDPQTGVRSSTREWSAQERLDARVAAGTARNIYYMQGNAGTNTGTLRQFTYANLTADGLNGHFDGACSKAPALAQCTTTSFDVAGANNGGNLVAWLRGQADTRYRARQHLLSDIVGGAPVFVGKPPFQYTENNYQTFVANMNASNSGAGRKGVVYAPSNGGMLHAFEASTGQELWAYVPTMVMNRMYRLADVDYATKHEYFVNATPVISDIWVPGSPGAWKTILVGGLGAGGRGYYALDITNPDSPSVLWEFSNDSLGGNSNLGLTFGNPVVTKRADGRWVVMFTSGYNNVSPGDGNGRLYVVDANTGQRLTETQTYTSGSVAAGSTATPSGLAKIVNWQVSARDNTTQRVYGGDLLGNVWRFDIDGLVAPNNAALRLAYLSAGSPAVAQPITTRPELATVRHGGVDYPVVYVATGKLLGLSDLSSTDQQSVYAIKDPLTNTPLGDVHARTDMVEQTLTVNTATNARTVTDNAVDWATKIGWRVDLPSVGERVNIDMRLALTTLVVGANAPSNDACTAGGTSYLYQFDFSSGSSLPDSNGVAGVWLGNSFAVGVGAMQLYSPTNGGAGRGGAITRTQMGDGSVRQTNMYTPSTAAVQGRRTSWRELID